MFSNRGGFPPLPSSQSFRAPIPPGPPQGPTPLNHFNNFPPPHHNKPIPLNAGFYENHLGMSSNWRPPPSLQGAPLNMPVASNNFFQMPSTISTNNDDEEVFSFNI